MLEVARGLSRTWDRGPQLQQALCRAAQGASCTPWHHRSCVSQLSWARGLNLLLPTLEPPGSFTWNPYLEPWNLPNLLATLEPSGTLTWNPGTLRKPRGTLRDDCPRVPHGLDWLRPQSFQLLGKKRPRPFWLPREEMLSEESIHMENAVRRWQRLQMPRCHWNPLVRLTSQPACLWNQ